MLAACLGEHLGLHYYPNKGGVLEFRLASYLFFLPGALGLVMAGLTFLTCFDGLFLVTLLAPFGNLSLPLQIRLAGITLSNLLGK